MKKHSIIYLIVMGLCMGMGATSCKVSEAILSKSGALIWGENCIRCHNAAAPDTFSDLEWDIVAMHMQDRANLTQDEIEKVIEFLKQAN